MENEAQADNREKSQHKETKGQPKSTRSSKKTILLALVICVITIGSLAILRGQIDSPRKDVMTVGHSVAAIDKTRASGIGADIEEVFKSIERSIESLLERISQWFDSLKADHASMNHELSGLANNMSAIHKSIVELRKGNEEIKQRIDVAQSQLQTIVKDVRGLKITAKKKGSKQRKRAPAKPPFHIDAIDMWDAAAYVAISQHGHVTFLREGGQRSGWTVTHIDRIKGQVAFRGPVGQNYSASLRR